MTEVKTRTKVTGNAPVWWCPKCDRSHQARLYTECQTPGCGTVYLGNGKAEMDDAPLPAVKPFAPPVGVIAPPVPLPDLPPELPATEDTTLTGTGPGEAVGQAEAAADPSPANGPTVSKMTKPEVLGHALDLGLPAEDSMSKRELQTLIWDAAGRKHK